MPLANKRRILYVDHNEDALLMITALFTQQGYEVITANNSLAALAIACQSPPDLYILDVHMPVMDGQTLARKIREVDTQTPIIFYSGAALESVKEMALQVGGNTFIPKPYIGKLIEIVTGFLE